MQWLVKEQTEEETLALNLLDKMKVTGGENAIPAALHVLATYLQTKSNEAMLAEENTVMNI